MAEIQVRVLGGFEAAAADGTPLVFPTRKTAQAFVILALAAGESVSRARLAALLWSDRAEEQARGSLRQALTALRKALDGAGAAGALETTAETARLDPEAARVDLLDAERLSAAEDPEALRRFAELARGGLLDGWESGDPAFEAWHREARARWEGRAKSALERLLEAERAAGAPRAALGVAERICEIDPTCERTHRAMMEVLAGFGDRTGALRAFARLRAALERELGVEPEPETAALAARLRRPIGLGTAAAPTSPTSTAPTSTAPPADAPAATGARPSAAPEAATPARMERRYAAVLAARLIFEADGDDGEVDPEARLEGRGRFADAVAAAARRFGGAVETRGESLALLLFGAPVALGNDCERALRAAEALTSALRSALGGVSAATGVANGAVFYGAAEVGAGALVSGRTVETAEALAAAAGPGETWLSAAARDALGVRIEAVAVEPVFEAAPGWRLIAYRPDASSAFVGRAAELAQLDAALDLCAEQGRGRVIHIRGEPGIGKTRLAEEARRRATARGFRTATAFVLDFGGRDRRDPVRAILRAAFGVEEGAAVEAEPQATAARLSAGRTDVEAALIHDLLDAAAPAPLRAALDAMEPAARLGAAQRMAATLVRERVAAGPLFLLVEDLHWIDAPALRGLAEIAAIAAEAPLAMALTSRVEGDPLDGAWRAQTRGAPLTTIDLGPMAPFEAQAMAAALLSDVAEARAAALAADCVDRAGGHPLFLEQLLRLSRHGDGASPGGAASPRSGAAPASASFSALSSRPSSAPGSVPASVQSVVQVRLDQIDAEARALAQAASVLGQRFERAGLAHLEARDGPALDSALAGLVGAGMIRPEGDAFLFAHALLRDGIYDTLLPRRRRALHVRAADWFAERDLVLRAEHLEQAGDPAAAQAFGAAAAQQLQAYRYGRARALVERGLSIAQAAADRTALTLALGEILHDLGAMAEAGAAFDAALRAAPTTLDRARALIGGATVKRVTDDLDGAFGDIAQAERTLVGEDSAEGLGERARAAFLRGNLLFPRGEAESCLAAHEQSLALARRAGRPELEAAALGGVGDAQYLAGRMKSAFETLSACVEISRRHGFGRIEVANLSQMACASIFLWPSAETTLFSERAAARAGEVGHRRAEINALAGVLWGRSDDGDYAGCLEAVAVMREKVRALGAQRYEHYAMMCRGTARFHYGETAEGIADLRVAVRLAEQSGPGFHGSLATSMLALCAPERAEAEAMVRRTAEILAGRCVGHSQPRAYPVAAGAAIRLGDPDLADAMLDLLERFMGDEVLANPAAAIRIWRRAAALSRGAGGERDPGAVEASAVEALAVEAAREGWADLGAQVRQAFAPWPR